MELQNVWFFIWGLLWAIYFMTDGFDLGIGALVPFLGKTDEDRRVMYNAMGPLWDGTRSGSSRRAGSPLRPSQRSTRSCSAPYTPP